MMMKRFLFVFLMLVLAAGSLSAQMRRPRVYTTNDPSVWVTAGIDGFRANVVNDGATSSMWNFGNSTNFQYRASIERGMTSGSSFGLAGSWGHVPFEYSSTGIFSPPAGGGTQCFQCDAHLDLMTLVATFHSGAGAGFHQIVELNGGVVAYRNLTQDSDGAKLAPSAGNIDPLFSFGYGFGYGLSDRTNIDFTSNYTIGLHERKGLSNGASNTNSMPSLRLSLRTGFGHRTVSR
jgi:hypothetical protein